MVKFVLYMLLSEAESWDRYISYPDAFISGYPLVGRGSTKSTPTEKKFSRQDIRMRGFNAFLLFVTVLMFLGGTIFICLDVSDLVRRMQIILVNNPGQSVKEKLDQANESLKKLVWTGEMLFIFMVGIEVYKTIGIMTWLCSWFSAILLSSGGHG